jgi:hypothetical protein
VGFSLLVFSGGQPKGQSCRCLKPSGIDGLKHPELAKRTKAKPPAGAAVSENGQLTPRA